jgi:DNA-binding response OmpR family regulator
MKDDPALCLLLADLVREAGYDPHVWSLDEDPWAFMRRVQPQLIVVDLWLRERGDGAAFSADLRGDDATMHVPVVVCSADPHALEVQVAQRG